MGRTHMRSRELPASTKAKVLDRLRYGGAPIGVHVIWLLGHAVKAFASAELNKLGIDGSIRRRWGRHGSTRYLRTPQQLSTAIHYVACNQGEPMALYLASR